MGNTSKGTADGTASMGMQRGMAEAKKLTNAGSLIEATQVIQRTLAGSPASGNAEGAGKQSPDGFDPSMLFGGEYRGEKRSSTTPLVDMPNVISPDLFQPTTAPAGGVARVPKPPTLDIPVGGQFVSGSFTNLAGTRGYKLYIPSGIPEKAVPLVVMLHGCNQNPDDFAAGTRMNALAEEHEFFVVYPEQSRRANMSACWNWFQAGDQVRDRSEPSIIAGITHQIAATQPIDTRRIYVAGMSAGGAMAVVMGETYPDLYAAVGVHSGLPYGAARDMPSAFQAMQSGGPSRSATTDGVPTIVFHGDRDGTVSQRNGEQILRRWAVTVPAERVAAGNRPQVTVRNSQVPDGHSYTRCIYHDADGRPVAEGWSIHGAGHAWAGGDPRISYTDSSGPDASSEMVRFFLEHPRR